MADKIVAMGSHSLSAEAKSCILFYLKAGARSLVYYSHLNFDKIKARIHFSTSAMKGSTPLKCFIAAGQNTFIESFDNPNSAYSVFTLFLT